MFTDEQRKALNKKLDRRLIYKLQGNSYVKGFVYKAKLNQIFGPDGWNTEIRSIDVHPAGEGKARTAHCHLRLTIGDVVKEDVGAGTGYKTEAVGDAIKEAVTDALKRCCAQLGWSTGLALYDDSERYIGSHKEDAE